MHRKTLAPGLAAMLLIVLGAIAVENSRAGITLRSSVPATPRRATAPA